MGVMMALRDENLSCWVMKDSMTSVAEKALLSMPRTSSSIDSSIRRAGAEVCVVEEEEVTVVAVAAEEGVEAMEDKEDTAVIWCKLAVRFATLATPLPRRAISDVGESGREWERKGGGRKGARKTKVRARLNEDWFAQIATTEGNLSF